MPIALFGSGEFTPAVNDIDSYLINNYHPKSITILPTAAGKEKDYSKWLDMAQKHYSQFPIDVITLPITNKIQANDPKQFSALDKADWIFFSGGDPNYLLEVLKDSKLWDLVIEKYQAGALLAGSSAGAMIMGTYVMSSPIMALIKPTEFNWSPSFGLVPFTIFPHFDRFKKLSTIFNRLIKQSPEKISNAWVGIDEDTALILNDNQRIILGKGKVEINY
jgi:cyanophycinase